MTETVRVLSPAPVEMCCSTFAPRAAVGVSTQVQWAGVLDDGIAGLVCWSVGHHWLRMVG